MVVSVLDNVAFGLGLNRLGGDLAERVEQALRRATQWDEVEDELQERPGSVRMAFTAAPTESPSTREAWGRSRGGPDLPGGGTVAAPGLRNLPHDAQPSQGLLGGLQIGANRGRVDRIGKRS
jgi:hypothetical protein